MYSIDGVLWATHVVLLIATRKCAVMAAQRRDLRYSESITTVVMLLEYRKSSLGSMETNASGARTSRCAVSQSRFEVTIGKQ